MRREGFPLARLVVVVGSGGVGKTTLAAALGLLSAEAGRDTLVMTFDPSLRLKDSLGVGDEARDAEVQVAVPTAGPLYASLLDARRTFDRLVARYSPDEPSRQRILRNRYYHHLAGSLAGILEYMAVERLFEVAEEGRHEQVILDTPPTRQALDFLGAPARIMGFLDSGAIKLALRPWFDAQGHLRPTSHLGGLGRRFERFLDETIGLDLLRDMAEFFQAFSPLYDGFRERAQRVEALLRSAGTEFVLVTGPGEETIPDALFFARRLLETGYRLGPIVVNRVHPRAAEPAVRPTSGEPPRDGRQLLAWLGERDHAGIEALGSLLPPPRQLLSLPLMRRAPTDLTSLGELASTFAERLTGAMATG